MADNRTVPLSQPLGVGQWDTWASRGTEAGTASGTPDLKALAHKVLQRDSKRDTKRDSLPQSVPGLIHPLGHFSTDPFEAPAGHAPEWRRWFNLLAQHKEDLGHSPEFAARLAYGEALTAWHLQHGGKPDPNHCAGCGSPVAHPVHTLPDGAAVWPTDDCLIAYGGKWRAAAAAALAAMGITIANA